VVVEDYTSPGFWQAALRFIILLLWVFSGLVAIYVILGS
jgi:succinate dehydrogenase hydrophobic anchor subunit